MKTSKATNAMRLAITLLRMAVGWHFLYEGVSKLTATSWTAAGFLEGSTGFMAGFYHWLAASEAMMRVVDPLNVFALVAIGLALFLGIMIRPAAVAGVLLLALYYFAYPPFGVSRMMQADGNLFIVNRIFIEAVILLLFVFLQDRGHGLGRLMTASRWKRAEAHDAPSGSAVHSRREALKDLAAVPVLGFLGWGAARDKDHHWVDGSSGATIKIGAADLSELKGELPKGRIGDLPLSRLVMGGNLIGGWAHSRDLLYVSSLFKAYNTEKKVFETLMLAEQAGIDSINIGFPSNSLLQKYKKVTGSRIKVITQVAAADVGNKDYFSFIEKAVDYGVDVIQIQGNQSDWLVRDGKVDVIGLMLDRIRSHGCPAGLGAHSVDALIACEEAGIIPDYYMKTMHHDRYWSAHPRENRKAFEVDGQRHLDHDKFHDNIFCLYPDRTIEFVKRATVPVMGFKVLAAGAIKPEDGFRWAFEHGADFICVGMFDFQVVNNVNTTIDILKDLAKRERSWFA